MAEAGVQPLVRRAARAVGMARAAEAVLLGLGAGLFAAAAAVASGGQGFAATWGPALLAALPMGAAWFLELRPRAGQVARQVDGRLGLDGALVSAYEVEGGRAGALGLVLGRRLRQQLALRTVLRAAIPNSTPLLAAPLLGVVALVLALEGRPTPPDPMAGVPNVLQGLAGAMDAAFDAATEGLGDGEVTAGEVEELRELAAEARALAREADGMGRSPERREEVARRVEELAEGLEQAARRVEGRPELAAPVEQALTLSDTARLACADQRAEQPGQPQPGEGAADPAEGGGPSGAPGADGDPAGTAPAVATPSGDGEGPPPLANDGADGTMVALPDGRTGQEAPPSVPPHTPAPDLAGGVALGPWWPERHAGVVRRYVEERRGDASDSTE